MNSRRNPGSPDSENSRPGVERKEPDVEDWVPLSVREARQARKMRADLWPQIWMSFASVIILAAALAILTYRMGAQNCH
jgi:hypothetical protein